MHKNDTPEEIAAFEALQDEQAMQDPGPEVEMDFEDTVIMSTTALLNMIEQATARGMKAGYQRALGDMASDGVPDVQNDTDPTYPGGIFLGNDDGPG